MPWKNESPMEQRQHLVSLALSGRFSVTSLCAELGVSRKTAHKWISRYKQHGAAGLADLSRAPKSVPCRTSDGVERLIIAGRRLHPTWGPKKIRVRLRATHGVENPPATSTVGAVLKRHGMVQFSRPGCPQDNGCHERMHRTMKAECCRPPSAHIDAQQQRFERWRRCFNHERPHEAISMRTPSELYQRSPRKFDPAIKFDLYGPGDQTRKVNSGGLIALDGHNHYVGDSFAGFKVALERDEKTGWVHVRYANVSLGHLTATASDRLRPTAYADRWPGTP